VKYWEIIADNLKKRGWSLGYVSALDSRGQSSHRGSENLGASMLIGFAPPEVVAFSFMVPNLSLKSFALPFSLF
jgi:hypothetical protein